MCRTFDAARPAWSETPDSVTVSEAIVLWTGWRHNTWPHQHDAAVIADYGEDVGGRLLDEARRLQDDFWACGERLTAADLVEMGDQAAALFRERHPDISEEAVRAMTWEYTFSNR